MPVTSHVIAVAGAANATLATAITNFNTAVATAVTNAQGQTGAQSDQVVANPSQLIWDGSAYVVSGSVSYRVVT